MTAKNIQYKQNRKFWLNFYIFESDKPQRIKIFVDTYMKSQRIIIKYINKGAKDKNLFINKEL